MVSIWGLLRGANMLFGLGGGFWKFVKIIFVGSVLLSFLGVGWLFVSQYIEGRPKFMTTLDGVTLGESEADVLFEKGIPSNPDATPDATHSKDLFYGETGISMTDGRVLVIQHSCSRLHGRDYTSLNGIGCGAFGEEIVARFGSDVTRLCVRTPEVQADKLMRMYMVERYNTRYILRQNRVEALSVINGKPTSYWVACVST